MAYIGVDKERYDAGNRFLSQDRYLANYNPRDAITFNVSPDNSGIMGMYPKYPYPPIMFEDGSDGGGPFGGIDKGEIVSDVGFGNLNDQTGMGYTLTEEDIENIAAQKNKDRLTQAAKLGLFALNPTGYLMGKAGKAAFDFAKNKFFDGDGDSGSGGGKGKNKGPNVPSYTYEGSDEQDKDNENTGPTGVDAGTADVQDYADIYEPPTPVYTPPSPVRDSGDSGGGGGSSSSDQGETSSDSGFSGSSGRGRDPDDRMAKGGRVTKALGGRMDKALTGRRRDI